MMPPKKQKIDYERVKLGELIAGVISNVEYDEKHIFNNQAGTKENPAIRFVFLLDGYKWPHRSKWMTFSLNEKSNLYIKFVSKLVKDATPDMMFDLDVFKGFEVKTIWSEKNDFQSIDAIYPLKNALDITQLVDLDEDSNCPSDEETVFEK